jgi:hypothetical protein
MWSRLLITANVVPNSLILSTLKMEGRVPLNRRFYQAPHGSTSHRRSLFLFPLIAIKNAKHTYIFISVYVFVYIFIYICVCFCTYIRPCIHIYMQTYLYAYGYETMSFPHVSRPSTRWLLWGCQPQAPNVLYTLEDPCHLFPWHAGSTPGS